MRDVAAAADVNDALLYRHFESKAQLFDEAVSNPLDEMVSHTFTPVAGEGEMRATAERFFTEGIEAMREILPLLTMVLADAERGEQYYCDHLRPAIDQMVDVTRANLNVWEHQQFSPELIVWIAWGVCWIIALHERFGHQRADLETVVPGVVDVIWNGLRTRVEGGSLP